MATKIVTKNSSTASAVPTASDLVQGELAVNVADKKLFTEDNSGAIIELADGVKLAGIEASADVTDTANVTAAGALMDSELTSEASVKALNQGVATTDSPAFAGLTVDTTTLAVDSTNNRVGIGTASPSTILDVKGAAARIRISDTDTAGTTGIEFVDSGGTKDAEIEVGSSTQYLAFKTATAERMRIDGSGQVGIGTSAPASKAHILGSSNDTISQANANLNVEGAGGNGMLFGTQATAPFRSYIQAGFVDNLATATYDLLLNPQGGNVGIGTSSPDAATTIVSANVATGSNGTLGVKADAAAINNGGQITLGTTSARHAAIAGRQEASGGSAGYLQLSTRGSSGDITERMRINSSGNLLVGTTTSAGGGKLTVDVGGISGTLVSFQNSQNLGGSITVVSGGGTSYNTSSDQRLKENIADADDAGSKIDAIQVRKYDWKVDGSHQDYGMIAQELLEVAPEAVSVPEDSEEMMGVDYSKLVPMLIKEIQSLRNRVAQLEE